MKNIIYLFTLLLSFSLIGCGGSDSGSSSTTQENSLTGVYVNDDNPLLFLEISENNEWTISNVTQPKATIQNMEKGTWKKEAGAIKLLSTKSGITMEFTPNGNVVNLGKIGSYTRHNSPFCGSFTNEKEATWTFEVRPNFTWTIRYPDNHHRTIEHGCWYALSESLVKLTRGDDPSKFRDIRFEDGRYAFEEYGWFNKAE